MGSKPKLALRPGWSSWGWVLGSGALLAELGGFVFRSGWRGGRCDLRVRRPAQNLRR
jgi:hypothetical protein